ncbi:MAG TPA: glutathione S-transferase, partial [Caulobacteraceae bacterium]|nr:glutathione S-transferase [Caulobacteraceae bacterium]
SLNVQKVMWTLDELGLAYEHVPAGGDFGLLDTPAFRAMNPHGWVPVIDDDGTVVWESGAIVRYLCAEYGAGSLWPPEPRRRAVADEWMEWSQTTLQRAMIGLFWAFWRTPEAERDPNRVAALLAQSDAELKRLDAQLAGGAYVAGDAMTMADIPIGTQMYRHFEMDIPRPALPNVEAWYERLRARPAYRAQVMRPFDDLKGRLAY